MLFPELPTSRLIDVPMAERRAPGTADLLDYDVLLSDRVIGHKAGALLAGFDFVGPPHDATEDDDLDRAEDRLAAALADLGSGWVIHVDVQRFRASAYPCKSVATDRAARRIEAIRRASFLGKTHFASRTTLWLTFFASSSPAAFFEQPEQHLDAFEAALRTFCDKLGSGAALGRLTGDSLVSRLRSALRLGPPREIAFHPASFLDAILAPGLENLPSGVLAVGPRFAVPIRLTGLPKQLRSGSTLPLTAAGLPLRLVTRLVMLSAWHAEAAIDRGRRRRETNRFSWRTLFRSLTRGKKEARNAERRDRNAGLAPNEVVQREGLAEANRALEASYRGERFVFLSTVLFAIGSTEQRAEDHGAELLGLLRAARLDAERDRFNEIQGYLGAAPGNAWANHRRFFQPLRAALALVPLTSAWQGEADAPHPLLRGHGPLAVVRGSADEAFFLNVHPSGSAQADLGHTLVVGPSGSGKSVLLNFIAASARRYPDARVISLDIDRSQKVHCRAADGAYFDLGADDLRFAPLFLLRQGTPEAAELTSAWLTALWHASHAEPLSDRDAEHLADALDEVMALDPGLHTLEALAAKVQSERLRRLFRRYSDGLFSGRTNAIETSSYTVIELRGLLGMRQEIKTPAFVHLQQLIQHALDGRPAWVLIDEGSHFLDDPLLAESIHDWLITLRKRNASVIFATQSLGHFRDPALRQIFSESCPTKVFLPNTAAGREQATREAYETAGLTERQIARIAEAQPKKHYLLVQPTGERLIDLALEPAELAILGASSPQAIERVEALRASDPESWLDRWIAESTSTRKEASP